MELLWFAIVGLMLTTYVVLDGLDLGAGIVHLLVARDDSERRIVIASIGPIWDGNEVWLVASGAALFLAFPVLFATALSGFYLPVMLVLWLLVFRALGIELRHQLHHPLWTQFWDAAFAFSSALLVFAFGVALGNIVRGVTFRDSGDAPSFFAPLWTDFGIGDPVGVLDWYTISVGLAAVALLGLYGALWLASRTVGELQQRSASWATRLYLVVASLGLWLTIATGVVRPSALTNLTRYPVGLVAPLLALGGFGVAGWTIWRERYREALYSTAAWIAGAMLSAIYAIFPMVLPARAPEQGLSIHESAASSGLDVALWWFVPGISLAIGYFVFVYRSLPTQLTEADLDH